MKRLKISLLCLLSLITVLTAKAQTAEKLGFKPGVQTYSFRLFSFEEALNKADSVGVKYVQLFPGQKIGGGIEGTMDYHMPASKRDSVLGLLQSKGITAVSYGVVTARNDEDWKQIFEFVKGMGMKQFATEPEPEFLPLVSKLADEYEVNVAIHNHPMPSRYWSPDTLTKYTAGYSKRLGSCADIGHWVRSGLDPVAMLKKLQGRVFELHMKDLHELPSPEYAAFIRSRPAAGQRPQAAPQGTNGSTPAAARVTPPAGPHDVPWGTGVSNIKGVLQELRRQKFNGPFFAEYEYNWANNVGELTQSMQYINEVTSKMK